MVSADERLEPLRVFEQVDVDRLVGKRNPQPMLQVDAPGGEILEEPVTGDQRKLAVDDQLLADYRLTAGERQPGGRQGRTSAPAHGRQQREHRH